MRKITVLTILLTAQISLAQDTRYAGSTLWSDVKSVEVVGNLAYCAFWNGLMIIDVSNPSFPAVVGQAACQGPGWDLDVSGNYAYFISAYFGLEIIDISIPTQPVVVGNWGGLYQFNDVALSGHYAYITGPGEDLQIINVSNPTNPVQVGSCHMLYGSGDVVVASTMPIYPMAVGDCR